MCTPMRKLESESSVDVDAISSSLKEVFKEVFEAEACDGDSMETILLWDSMGHMILMAALEHKFGIRIDARDIIRLTSVVVLKEYLREHL